MGESQHPKEDAFSGLGWTVGSGTDDSQVGTSGPSSAPHDRTWADTGKDIGSAVGSKVLSGGYYCLSGGLNGLYGLGNIGWKGVKLGWGASCATASFAHSRLTESGSLRADRAAAQAMGKRAATVTVHSFDQSSAPSEGVLKNARDSYKKRAQGYLDKGDQSGTNTGWAATAYNNELDRIVKDRWPGTAATGTTGASGASEA